MGGEHMQKDQQQTAIIQPLDATDTVENQVSTPLPKARRRTRKSPNSTD